ncbi:MAG: hypothetical protein ACFFCS_28985 [Candidatus Hodarchaeota archaeon]
MMERTDLKEYGEREKEILYRISRLCNAEKLEDLCDDLLDMILESKSANALKSSAIGVSIFHMMNTDTLNTYVGFQRLIEAGMMIEPDATVKIIEDHGETTIADELNSLKE